jgi:UDP-N-acetylglucosamine kinase
MEAYKEQFSKILQEVHQDITEGRTSTSRPRAIILGGQPGSGKTTIHNIAKKDIPDLIIINGDDFRKRHPNFAELVQKYGDDSVKYTGKFAGEITDALIKQLASEKYNLLVEGTLRTIETPLQTCALLQSHGYDVELAVMAVHKDVSWQGTLDRYQAMQEVGLTPRATPKDHHDLVVSVLPENLSQIYHKNVFDRIRLFTREKECVYDNLATPEQDPKLTIDAKGEIMLRFLL